jgi:hypothetical protein
LKPSRQTATAISTLEVTLEIDVPTHHQADQGDTEVAAVRDGHSAIVPWMPQTVATRGEFSSQ